MVDPQEEGTLSTRSLVERLEEAPKKILDYLSSITKSYVAHVLGLIRSYWPHATLAPLAFGIAVNCLEENFIRYRDEAEPLAE